MKKTEPESRKLGVGELAQLFRPAQWLSTSLLHISPSLGLSFLFCQMGRGSESDKVISKILPAQKRSDLNLYFFNKIYFYTGN